MITFITQHQFWAAVAGYWILSAAVSAFCLMAAPYRACIRSRSWPEPAGNGRLAYLWLYRFLHTLAGNITTALGNRISGLSAGIKSVGTGLLLLLLVSCAAHYSIHPGALNKTDSEAYDTLLIAETTIDQARLDVKAGQLPADANSALDTLIRSYNLARASWLAYRGVLATNMPSQEYFDQLTKNLSDLSAAMRVFAEVTK